MGVFFSFIPNTYPSSEELAIKEQMGVVWP